MHRRRPRSRTRSPSGEISPPPRTPSDRTALTATAPTRTAPLQRHRRTADRDAAPNGASAASDDEYAEWDSADTIDAVANALAAFGEVVRLEANADFPQNLRDSRVDIVFNIAEGLHGVNREAHVPAICEFYGVPYSASDPFTLSLCLDKAKTKEVLAYHGVPTARSPSCARTGTGDGRLGTETSLATMQHARGKRPCRVPVSRLPLPGLC